MYQQVIHKEQGITAVIGVPEHKAILELIARLALLGRVQVIVGGNRFDARQLARIVRRHTVELDQTLGRIRQARPFTCYQAVRLLEDTRPTVPIVALDLLTTFYDESISDAESVRLVNRAAAQLRRLGRQVPVLITLQPDAPAGRQGLTKLVRGVAHQVYVLETPPTMTQPRLL